VRRLGGRAAPGGIFAHRLVPLHRHLRLRGRRSPGSPGEGLPRPARHLRHRGAFRGGAQAQGGRTYQLPLPGAGGHRLPERGRQPAGGLRRRGPLRPALEPQPPGAARGEGGPLRAEEGEGQGRPPLREGQPGGWRRARGSPAQGPEHPQDPGHIGARSRGQRDGDGGRPPLPLLPGEGRDPDAALRGPGGPGDRQAVGPGRGAGEGEPHPLRPAGHQAGGGGPGAPGDRLRPGRPGGGAWLRHRGLQEAGCGVQEEEGRFLRAHFPGPLPPGGPRGPALQGGMPPGLRGSRSRGRPLRGAQPPLHHRPGPPPAGGIPGREARGPGLPLRGHAHRPGGQSDHPAPPSRALYPHRPRGARSPGRGGASPGLHRVPSRGELAFPGGDPAPPEGGRS